MEGTIYNITYYNTDSNYCVMRLEPHTLVLGSGGGLVTVVGVMPEMQAGETVRIEGEWVVHAKYGRQFEAYQISRILPVTIEGMRRYLGSGLISGVGEKTAEKIVAVFGTDTLKVLDAPNASEQLCQVPKISQRRAEKILAAWREHREMADVMMFLQQYDIGTALSMKIYKYYNDNNKASAFQVIQSNPYQLVRDINGVGFRTADRIALNIGLARNAPARMEAALIYLMDQAAFEGHLYLPQIKLIGDACEALEIDEPENVTTALERLVQLGDLRRDEVENPFDLGQMLTAVYTPIAFSYERGAARMLVDLLRTPQSNLRPFFKEISSAKWAETFRRLVKDNKIPLTAQQEFAVRTALIDKLSILTGGPGTGKTTTLRALITILLENNCTFKLAAPTGRAAKRLQQATGQEASTIHRLLKYSSTLRNFTHDTDDPLKADMVIIDEASMLDMHLFFALLRALPPNTHLLLVGDVDQLPSVGAGDVLRDVIRSKICRVTRLKNVFRQEDGSQIIQNAHLINEGKMPNLESRKGDFFFFGKEDPQEAADLLIDIVKNRIPEKFGFHSVNDIQVLCPMYRTPVGVYALNAGLQEALNPPDDKAEQQLFNNLFRVGDKVIQTRNNYELQVFNGDIGRVHSINKEKKLLDVAFEDSFATYDWLEADQLSLAYACSVHRSQGSEYPVVVVPILTQHYMMLQRNLFYTAITRARKMVVVVGTRKAISIAVRNNQVTRRWTALDWRLSEAER